VDVNSAVGRKAGLTDEKLLTVAQSARAPQGDFDFSIFNEKERLTIELADAMADTPSNISDELFRRLREEFSEEQLLELGAHIAFENFRARYNREFDVGSDDLYHPTRGVQRWASARRIRLIRELSGQWSDSKRENHRISQLLTFFCLTLTCSDGSRSILHPQLAPVVLSAHDCKEKKSPRRLQSISADVDAGAGGAFTRGGAHLHQLQPTAKFRTRQSSAGHNSS